MKTAVMDFIERNSGRTAFLEHEIKGFLKGIGLAVPNGMFVRSGEKVPDITLKYPLIAKVSSLKITSKSDVGGVKAGIKDKNGLEEAVKELMQIEDAEGVQGVLVEEMASPGIEVIVGGIIDKQFGPIIMFGLGGVFVELFGDTAFALAPLKKGGATWLIQQVKGYKLIEGYHGNPAVDKEALIKIILVVSEIVMSGYVEGLDLNPVVLYPENALILDAKIKIRVR